MIGSAGPNNSRGGALLVALVAVALATLLALGLIERGQQTLARTQALIASERAYQYALAMDVMAESLLRRALEEGIEASLLDGTWTPPYEVPGGVVLGRLIDQQARFNLNALAHPDPALASLALERFERLLLELGLNPLIALELADWLDGARVPRPGSAGDSWYATRQPPYRMPGMALAHVSELRWLRSVDEAAFAALAPRVSALPEPELRLNVNTVDPSVLASLVPGLEPAQAARLLADGPFADVPSFLSHPILQGLAVPQLEAHLTVSSRYFLAQARVVLDGVERDYFRLIRVDGSGYDFRLFSQGTP